MIKRNELMNRTVQLWDQTKKTVQPYLSSMKSLLFGSFLVLIGGFSAAADEEPFELRQRDRIHISSRVVSVGDVLYGYAGKDELKKQLKNKFLGLSPVPGNSNKVTREEIELELRKLGMRTGEDFSLSGPKTTEIVRTSGNDDFSSYIRSESDWYTFVNQRIQKQIKEKSKFKDAYINVKVLKVLSQEGKTPEGTERPEVTVQFDKSIFRGRIPVRVRAKKEGSEFKRATYLVSLTVRMPVWVVTHKVPATEPVRKKDVIAEYRRVPEGIIPVLNRKEIIGKRADRELEAGTIYSRQVLDEQPVIQEGDQVQLLTEPGGIEIRQSATALESGAPGDVIKLRLEEERTLKGIVLDASTVRKDLDQNSSDKMKQKQEVQQ